jgi:hypothetical protein
MSNHSPPPNSNETPIPLERPLSTFLLEMIESEIEIQCHAGAEQIDLVLQELKNYKMKLGAIPLRLTALPLLIEHDQAIQELKGFKTLIKTTPLTPTKMASLLRLIEPVIILDPAERDTITRLLNRLKPALDDKFDFHTIEDWLSDS